MQQRDEAEKNTLRIKKTTNLKSNKSQSDWQQDLFVWEVRNKPAECADFVFLKGFDI